MSSRDTDAPRLIEWTGERAVPWSPDAQIAYEHYHRYLWARALVKGRRVLELGSGEGFGAALLAEAADAVVGVDISREAVEHSRLNYSRANLSFGIASATDLSHLPDASFNAVVAFEIIEHVDDQEAMLGEIARVLSDDGVLIISTPDRRAYFEASGGQGNPFHTRELSRDELYGLLATHFRTIYLFGQRAMTGSRIEAFDKSSDAPETSFNMERHADKWRLAGDMTPVYLLALAANRQLREVPRDSTLCDFELGMLRTAERAAVDAAVRSEGLAAELVAAERWRRELEQIRGTVTWRLRECVLRRLGGSTSPGVQIISRTLRWLGRSPHV